MILQRVRPEIPRRTPDNLLELNLGVREDQRANAPAQFIFQAQDERAK